MYDLNQVIDMFFLHDLNLSHTLWCSVHLISIFEPAENINFEAASDKVFEAHLIAIVGHFGHILIRISFPF